MKKKIAIFQEFIPHYRVEFFNALSELYEVTVMHTQPLSGGAKTLNFKTQYLKSFRVMGIRVCPDLPQKLQEITPDCVIIMADLRWVTAVYMGVTRFRDKCVWWGLDTGKNELINILRRRLFKKARVIAFYSDSCRSKFRQLEDSGVRCLVARNTVGVTESESGIAKDRKGFLNVGSLNQRKDNVRLLYCYQRYVRLARDPWSLTFVGDGPDRARLEQSVTDLGLSDHVKFLGHLDEASGLLPEIYANSGCSISLGQAGLSILQSFGYATPFISTYEAISGGELDNIIDGYNGVLARNDADVIGAMLRVSENPDTCELMAENSFRYYNRVASLEQMVKSFSDAIEFIEASR